MSDRAGSRTTGVATLRPVRIACVYGQEDMSRLVVANMSHIRWVRMAEALARRGHQVDLVVNRRERTAPLAAGVGEVSFEDVRWERYDVVKTFFHRGFDALRAAGGAQHPFILSKLGSVVGREQTPGVHFYGAVRAQLLETQEQIARRSRVVTILTAENADLWRRTHGAATPLVQVPTGVDAELPPPGPSPYPAIGVDGPVALFAGNLYSLHQQPEINRLWQDRLNRLGRALDRAGLRLVAMGTGVTDRLDRDAVVHVGPVPLREFWDWQRHAAVGLVLAQSTVQDNESSKIYYYLRTGLPVVCEQPVPNAWLVRDTGHGVLVPYDDVEALAAATAKTALAPPLANGLPQYMALHHSWDARARLYDAVLAAARRDA